MNFLHASKPSIVLTSTQREILIKARVVEAGRVRVSVDFLATLSLSLSLSLCTHQGRDEFGGSTTRSFAPSPAPTFRPFSKTIGGTYHIHPYPSIYAVFLNFLKERTHAHPLVWSFGEGTTVSSLSLSLPLLTLFSPFHWPLSLPMAWHNRWSTQVWISHTVHPRFCPSQVMPFFLFRWGGVVCTMNLSESARIYLNPLIL